MTVRSVRFSLALLVAPMALADAPLEPPKPWRICDRAIQYCAHIDPKAGTQVFRIEEPFSAKELYRIPGWFRSAAISEDGHYFVAMYSGINLVPMDVLPSQVMVTIWKDGKKSHEITLGQILKNLSSMPTTASHYRWGSLSQFSKGMIQLDTVEGVVTVSAETGTVLRSP